MSVDNFSEEWIRDMLKPLQSDSSEYHHQYKMLSEFQRRLLSLESVYREIHAKVTALEKELAQTPASSIWDNFS